MNVLGLAVIFYVKEIYKPLDKKCCVLVDAINDSKE